MLITVAPLGGTGSVSYTDMGLTAGDTYDYQVSAVNAVGSSAYSNIASETAIP